MAELLGAVMSHHFTTVLAIDHGRGDGHSDETLTVGEGLILALLPPPGWFTGQRLLPLMERAEAGR